jgi:hypothetical protein
MAVFAFCFLCFAAVEPYLRKLLGLESCPGVADADLKVLTAPISLYLGGCHHLATAHWRRGSLKTIITSRQR